MNGVIVVLAIGLAAALGGGRRYLLDHLIQHQHDMIFPLGTLVINVIGPFVLGLTTGLAAHHGLPSGPTLVIGVVQGWVAANRRQAFLVPTARPRARSAQTRSSHRLSTWAGAAGCWTIPD
jgi:hypothetical protein